VRDNVKPSMGAEDFSYMLEKVPGAMVMLGNGGTEAINLHNSRYDFNDMAIPFGISFFVKTVESFLGEKNAG
jgi:hippurate hydrolase